MTITRTVLSDAGFLAFSCASALAQQIAGVPGSPEVTTTITGKQFPPPDPKFGGVIKEKARSSRPGGRRASYRPRARPRTWLGTDAK